MRHFTLLLSLLVALAVGCSRKNAPGPEEQGPQPTQTPEDAVTAQRNKLLAALKGSNQKARQEAVDELSAWVESDPPTVAALLELLRDKTTAGAGKTFSTQINSTREAAARALVLAGPPGEAILKEKGLAALREGLSDPSLAVREHTVYTIGLLGPLGRPLSAEVMKLCTHPSPNVRQAAFDALREIGVTDKTGFVAFLTNENPEVAQLAAEQVRNLGDLPAEAIPLLVAALDQTDGQIRSAAAAALAAQRGKAAAAAPALAEAVRKTFSKPYDPNEPYDSRTDEKYWEALRRIGEPATGSLVGLLTHHHPRVRGLAARTIGEIGPPAKAAADPLKAALRDDYGFVAIEAACALCAIGAGQAEAVELIKRAMDTRNSVALQAIEAIPRMKEAGQPLIPLALAKLTSDNLSARVGAVDLVGKLDKAEAAKWVPELAKLVSDKEPAVRDHVADVLKKLGPAAAPAAAALGQALPHEEHDSVRKRFVEALVAMGAGARPAIPGMLACVADKAFPMRLRLQLIPTLAVADPASPEVAAALITTSSDADAAMRQAAVEALARLDPIPEKALARLVAVAKTDSRLAPRVAALRGLAALGPRARPIRGEVESLAAQSQADLVLWSKVVLAAIDGDVTKAAEAVRAGLAEPSAAIRAAAAEGLLLVGPARTDLPVLLKLLKDSGAGTRAAAARSVARIGPAAKEAVPLLTNLLRDGDDEVKLAAILALAEMGPAAKPAIDRLKELRGESPIGEAAKKALEKIGWREKE